MSFHYQQRLHLKFPNEHDLHVTIKDSHFPVSFANDLARLEAFNKHLYRPNTYLHKWWARRCGSTFRLILKSLVEDPCLTDYYTPGGLEGKIILDPMMGGGTTLHEAIRLGANVIGIDIDPIPVLQVRASLSDIPLEELESYYRKFYTYLADNISSYFMTSCPDCGQASHILFTLYGLKRFCSCGEVILMDSTNLRFESDGSLITICPECHEISKGHHVYCHSKATYKIVERTASVCSQCGEPYQEDTASPFYARYIPVAIVGQCKAHGLFFNKPAKEDLQKIEQANSARPNFENEFHTHFKVVSGPKSCDLVKRNIHSYLDLFSSRQLLYLSHCEQALSKMPHLIRLNMALLVSTSLEFNCMLCGYKGGDKRRPGAVRHTFAHHAYSFPYTSLENNPLFPSKTSGSLQNLFASRIQRGRKWAINPKERMVSDKGPAIVTVDGEVDTGDEVFDYNDLTTRNRGFLLIQGSSTSIPLESKSVDYVITDPPYFDSVQYSDLAAFFRSWLRRFLREEADWDYDLTESAVDPHTSNGNGRYAELLGSIFKECYRVLRKDKGRLIFTFHHWNPKGWNALTVALKKAGFLLINRHIVHSENPSSVHISYQKALKHDAILIMGPSMTSTDRKWILPEKVDKSDSRQFCEDCATVLGWMLQSSLTEKEIEATWSDLLK
jgi:putative DNA methylase